MARVTLQTIADAVGVSRMTVSNAFSRPDQLSTALRDTILAAAAELGYTGPDPAARALARGSVGAIGVVLTDSLEEAFLDPVASAFFGAVAATLAPTGVAVSLIPAAKTGGHVTARDLAIDGALVCACQPDAEAVTWLRRRGLPLVFVDNDAPPGYPSVTLDERAGGRSAAQHLIDLGHRDIAVLTMEWERSEPGWRGADEPELSNMVARERLAGAMEAFEPAGITPRVYLVRDNVEREWGPGVEAMVAEDHPTAVVCFSDLMAAAVVTAAHARHLSVPGDLSVVGFDDIPLATAIRPALTTVRQDFRAKGRMAALALLEATAHGRADDRTPDHGPLTVPVELVVRDSTGPAPGA